MGRRFWTWVSIALRDLAHIEHLFQLAHPELREEFPPLKSLGNFRQNLPVQLTSFIGRESEQKTVRALINDHRVVTLIGSGGCGKTRLAIQVGADLLEQFPDGVRFVDLSPLSDPSLILDGIAEAVEVKLEQSDAKDDALVRTLKDTKTLIILDNCEHLVRACADAVSVLLRTGEHVRILATSREPLGLPGESTWRVPSLSLPDGATNAQEVSACEAVQLFVDRAAARQGFVLSAGNTQAIVDICRTLEGVPLAIELAAARVKALSPREIRDRLSDRFRLLTGGRGRHQTLRSAIDWSYDLLSEQERELFRRLSVFAGSFDLAGVEAIWPERDPLDHIEQLVDKSLLTVEQLNDERLRYRLLETLRQYGAERLAEAVRKRRPGSGTLAITLLLPSAPTNNELKTRQLRSPRSKLITMISAWRCAGRAHVHGIFFGLHRRSGGFGICAPIITREERGSRKRWRWTLTKAHVIEHALCGH